MKQSDAENLIKTRVIQALTESKISVNRLATASEFSQRTLNDQINGNSKISAATLVALADFHQDLSAEWLLRGEGEMYRGGSHIGTQIGKVQQNGILNTQNINTGNQSEQQPDNSRVFEQIIAEKDARIAELKDQIAMQKDYINMLKAQK